MAITRYMYDYGSLTSFRSLFQRWLIIHSEFFNMWNLRWPPKCHISIQFFGRCRFMNNQRKHRRVQPQEIGTSFVMIVTRKDNLKLSNSSCIWQWTNWSCQVIPILSSFLQVFFSHFWLSIFLPKNCQLYWLGNKVVPSIHNGSPSITRTCWHR